MTKSSPNLSICCILKILMIEINEQNFISMQKNIRFYDDPIQSKEEIFASYFIATETGIGYFQHNQICRRSEKGRNNFKYLDVHKKRNINIKFS